MDLPAGRGDGACSALAPLPRPKRAVPWNHIPGWSAGSKNPGPGLRRGIAGCPSSFPDSPLILLQ